MGTGWVFAAIALAGAGFMLRFLIALLREGAPSVCYWVIPRREPRECLEKQEGLDVDHDWPAGLGKTVVVRGKPPAAKRAGSPALALYPRQFPGSRILARLRIGAPW